MIDVQFRSVEIEANIFSLNAVFIKIFWQNGK